MADTDGRMTLYSFDIIQLNVHIHNHDLFASSLAKYENG